MIRRKTKIINFTYFRIINVKPDATSQSFEDISVNNVDICAKRIKSSEVHKNSLNSQNHQNGLENTKFKTCKVCEKHSKKLTSYANASDKNSKNATCHSKSVTQLQKMDNDLKLIFANKSVKKSMKLKSVQKSKSVESSVELKSAQEICTESVKRKKSKSKQKSKNTKLCCDVDDDTLILCIDEDEAFDILFGDLKRKVLKSFKEHKKDKHKQENT